MKLKTKCKELLREVIAFNYYGYPNLGRPNDYFEVTPFEAIFCGPRIQRHIRVNEASPFYVDSLKQFVLNEVEPWYLGLQNMRVGTQARSDYRYYSYRRAKHRILVGKDVTPKTDIGEYTVESNGKLTLQAGDAIVVKDGTHFKAGSIVHIKPFYQGCSNSNLTVGGGEPGSTKADNEYNMAYRNTNEPLNESKGNNFMVYPNPAERIVTITSENRSIPESIEFYNLQGRKVLQKNSKQSKITIDLGDLKSGIYIIRITSKGRMFNKKIVVK